MLGSFRNIEVWRVNLGKVAEGMPGGGERRQVTRAGVLCRVGAGEEWIA